MIIIIIIVIIASGTTHAMHQVTGNSFLQGIAQRVYDLTAWRLQAIT